VIPDADQKLRADAARNAELVLRAAREVYAELGPGAPLEAIAQRAGVGLRTLYRRFPQKEELLRAVLVQAIDEQVNPVIERAMGDEDPKRGLVTLMEATLEMVAREQSVLGAATNAGALTAEVTAPILDAIKALALRAQQAGLIRADLTADDMPRIMGMVTSVLWGADPDREDWRRYLALLLDALDPQAATPLPQAGPTPPRSNGHCAT